VVGRRLVLTRIQIWQVPEDQQEKFLSVVEGLEYTFFDETDNPVFTDFMR